MIPLWLSYPLSALGVLGSLLWIRLFVNAARNRHSVRKLSDLPSETPEGGWPALAVIFAARDEAEHVEQAARSILALDYPNLRVVAVDDRSRDDTGAILDRLALEDPRLAVVHVGDLPSGWLGKTHALQIASEAADAPWLLFTDADVHFATHSLRKAMTYALSSGADHLVVSPAVPTEGFGERLFLVMFQLAFTLDSPGWWVEDMRRRTSIGVGAFNLVRAEPFHDLGGFRRIGLSVDEDLQLGRALKWAGYQPRVVLGQGEVSVRWQVGLRGMIRGLEKNFFAAARFRLSRVLLFSFGILVSGVCPFVGLFVGPIWTRVICGLGVVVITILTALVGGQSRVSFAYGPLVWLSALILTGTLWWSTLVTYLQGGVRWRGHLYSLTELRRHVRLREHWMRELWKSTR